MSIEQPQHEIRWRSVAGPGTERLRLYMGRNFKARGDVVGWDDDREFRVSYAISLDPLWRVRRVRVRLLSGARPGIDLIADGNGNWIDGHLHPLAELGGCIDVDISATPFTNTLPIRRLGLRRGESAELAVVFIDVPAMTIEPVRQRYTCLEQHVGAGALYRFESLPYAGLPDGFTATLPVDAEGLVLDYPGLFTRVRPH
jgi:uncharacterized protein